MFGITDYNQPIVDFSNFDIADLGSAAGFGGAMVLIGMVTIFSVLCLLWGCLILFKIAFHDIPAKRSKAAESEIAEEESIVPATAIVSAEDEIVAVIAAAIAMAESESSDTKFKVVSFKRK